MSILRLIDHHFITYYDGRIQHRHREAAFFTFVIAPLFTFVIAPLFTFVIAPLFTFVIAPLFTFVIAPLFTFVIAPLFTFVIARPKAAAILSAADRLLRRRLPAMTFLDAIPVIM